MIRMSYETTNDIDSRGNCTDNLLSDLYLSTASMANHRDKNFVLRLKNVLDQNFDNNTINVEKISSLLYMTRRHLHRKTVGLFGLSPIHMLRTYRIEKAKQLLEAKKSVNEVAHETGFSNINYFITSFKKVMNITPKQYQKRYLESVKASRKLTVRDADNESSTVSIHLRDMSFSVANQ